MEHLWGKNHDLYQNIYISVRFLKRYTLRRSSYISGVCDSKCSKNHATLHEANRDNNFYRALDIAVQCFVRPAMNILLFFCKCIQSRINDSGKRDAKMNISTLFCHLEVLYHIISYIKKLHFEHVFCRLNEKCHATFHLFTVATDWFMGSTSKTQT